MKTVDFSETIEACDLKVGRYRLLTDFMKVCEYYRSRSLLDLHKVVYIQKFKPDFLRNYWAILN